ncbi:MAG: DUF3419 family protein [Gemmataceae bacterium]
MKLGDWISNCCFQWVHGHNLVYNTCWEDPRLDRQALRLGVDDTIAMITSAGCNALDYALLGPRRIHAIDMNHRQNALLELKMAGIRRLEFDDFFSMFGHGCSKKAEELYRTGLRPELSQPSCRYGTGISSLHRRSPSVVLLFGAAGAAGVRHQCLHRSHRADSSAIEEFLKPRRSRRSRRLRGSAA